MKTPQEIEQEKYELRIINRDIERQQSVDDLKKKHLISGTLDEQKLIVKEKEDCLEKGTEYSDRFKEEIKEEKIVEPIIEPVIEPITTDEQVIEEIKKIEDITVPIEEPIEDVIITPDEIKSDIIIEPEQSQESQT